MASSHVRILLTGFEPFDREPVNPSKEIALHFAGRGFCDTLILPVSYERAVAVLKQQLAGNFYDYVLMIGQAGKRKNICLERVAVNQMQSTIPDEDGVHVHGQKIIEAGVERYVSTLPLNDWIASFQSKNRAVEISESAGQFVCNYLYYQILREFQERRSSTRALFIHVPYLTEQIVDKPLGTPAMELQEMITIIEELIQLIS